MPLPCKFAPPGCRASRCRQRPSVKKRRSPLPCATCSHWKASIWPPLPNSGASCSTRVETCRGPSYSYPMAMPQQEISVESEADDKRQNVTSLFQMLDVLESSSATDPQLSVLQISQRT